MTAPVCVQVATPSRSYPIHIGAGILADPQFYPAGLQPERVVVVSNEVVAPLYLDAVRAALGAEVRTFIMADGEIHKSLETCSALLDALLDAQLGRDTLLVALGGGVVGDLTGFAAAIYQRGIAFVQIPTTLLAQVDSSVGGKTAINRPRGKNMVGAFHQPIAVICDPHTLRTLPQREFCAGLAEVIKYGLLGDRDFFAWLESQLPALLARDEDTLIEAIRRSCEHKARIVAADETETGQRALLNLGHTFGHAIEAHLGYRDWLHGEAVACGMLMAADMSARMGALTAADVDRVRTLLQRAELPIAPPSGLAAASMLHFMRGDKKNLAGRIRLVLLKAIGEAYVCADYPDQLLSQTLQHYCD